MQQPQIHLVPTRLQAAIHKTKLFTASVAARVPAPADSTIDSSDSLDHRNAAVPWTERHQLEKMHDNGCHLLAAATSSSL